MADQEYQVTKQDLKEMLSSIVDSLSTDDPEDYPRTVSGKDSRTLRVSLQSAILAATGQGFWGSSSGNVICELSNNAKSVAVSDAVQCPGCSRYFCKEHKMDNCPNPNCGRKLP